jgi:hypothetical protein
MFELWLCVTGGFLAYVVLGEAYRLARLFRSPDPGELWARMKQRSRLHKLGGGTAGPAARWAMAVPAVICAAAAYARFPVAGAWEVLGCLLAADVAYVATNLVRIMVQGLLPKGHGKTAQVISPDGVLPVPVAAFAPEHLQPGDLVR